MSDAGGPGYIPGRSPEPQASPKSGDGDVWKEIAKLALALWAAAMLGVFGWLILIKKSFTASML